MIRTLREPTHRPQQETKGPTCLYTFDKAFGLALYDDGRIVYLKDALEINQLPQSSSDPSLTDTLPVNVNYREIAAMVLVMKKTTVPEKDLEAMVRAVSLLHRRNGKNHNGRQLSPERNNQYRNGSHDPFKVLGDYSPYPG